LLPAIERPDPSAGRLDYLMELTTMRTCGRTRESPAPSAAGCGRYANPSLRVIMPGAYGDRRKLTPAIHRQYLALFRSIRARSDAGRSPARCSGRATTTPGCGTQVDRLHDPGPRLGMRIAFA
jgi:hypothetical protein